MPPQWSHNPPMGQVTVQDSVARQSRNLAIQEAYFRSSPPLHPPPRVYVPCPYSGPAAKTSSSQQGPFEIPSSVLSDTATDFGAQKDPPHLSNTQPFRSLSLAERGLMENGFGKRGETRIAYGQQHPWPSGPSTTADDNSTVYRYIQEQDDNPKDHAIWVLVWLSFLDPFMSLICAIFSIGVTTILLLVSPVRFCRPLCSSTSTSIIRATAPLFRSHLKLMYAPSVDNAYTFDFNPTLLVLIQLVSPVLSIGVMLAAWIAAAFWLFALMMGNPDGTERSDDGRAAVLGVRNWWEKFHLYALR